MSIASQRQTCPNAPSPNILKNFNRCLGKSQQSDLPCEFELLVDSCDVACNIFFPIQSRKHDGEKKKKEKKKEGKKYKENVK